MTPVDYWTSKKESLLSFLDTSENGLSSAQTLIRKQKFGSNDITKAKRETGFSIFLRQIKNPFIIMLLIVDAISFLTGEKISSMIIFIMIVVNSFLGFIQENKAERSLDKLKKYVIFNSKVRRDGKVIEIDSRDIVPGDIVCLTTGDIIPADIRLLKEQNLSVNEAVLTGESLPVSKNISDLDISKSTPQKIKNGVFLGTTVESGSAMGVVVSIGKNTFLGKAAIYLEDKSETTDFEKNVKSYSEMLLRVVIIFALSVFAASFLTGKSLLDSLIFGMVLAMGITPEIFPIIVTISLSNGAYKLAKNKVIVRRLAAIEDFGNIEILCCDKTGTLTEGELKLREFISLDNKKNEKALLYSLVCNSYNPQSENLLLRTPIDKAIWNNITTDTDKRLVNNFQLLDFRSFDFNLKRMTVLAKGKGNFLISKGASESILKISTKIVNNGKTEKITTAVKKKFSNFISKYENLGYKVIAVANKVTKENKIKAFSENESGYTIVGFLLFYDAPKPTAKKALDLIENLGVSLKLITGDNEIITRKICEEVDLKISRGKIITEEVLDKLSEKEFSKYVYKYNVFSGVTPEKKYRIISELKKTKIVGYLGDGINDVGGLKAANVGISVNSATDVAKEAADIIILQKGLTVLANGIVEGRKIFKNVMKSILNLMSSNYGNVITMGFLSVFLKFLPLLPSQLLFIDMVSDVPHIAVSTDSVDPVDLKKPAKWNMKFLSRFMLFFGLISTFFDLILIVILTVILKSSAEIFRTAWFLESMFSELLVTFSIRTRYSFLKSKPSKSIIFITILAALVSIFAVYSNFGALLFNFVKLPLNYLAIIVAILILYFFTIEFSKRQFYKRFKEV